MQQELKVLLEQASASDLVEAQKMISTLLRGHSGVNHQKVKLQLKRTNTSSKPPQALHLTAEFTSKALAKIFYEVFGWQVNAQQIRSHPKFDDALASLQMTVEKLELQNDLYFPILLELGRIIKRRQEGSPTDLSSYKVLDKLIHADELLTRSHPASAYIKGYFSCLRREEGVDNKK